MHQHTDFLKRLPRKNYFDIIYTEKTAPLQYFVDQLNFLSERFSEGIIYFYIFANSRNPKLIANQIFDHLNHKERFIVDFRKDSFATKTRDGVLSDFFSMLNFDCLIRPSNSSFSSMAHLLKNYKIILYPTAWKWQRDCLVMKKIHLEIDGHLESILEY